MTTASDLHKIGTRLRAAGATRGDWLTYLDGTLPLLLTALKKPTAAPGCAVCAARRVKKAAAQKRWRAGRGAR